MTVSLKVDSSLPVMSYILICSLIFFPSSFGTIIPSIGEEALGFVSLNLNMVFVIDTIRFVLQCNTYSCVCFPCKF